MSADQDISPRDLYLARRIADLFGLSAGGRNYVDAHRLRQMEWLTGLDAVEILRGCEVAAVLGWARLASHTTDCLVVRGISPGLGSSR